MHIFSSEVIYAVGDVAGLLYLCQKVAGTDGMQSSCGQEIEVAFVGLMCGNDILKPPQALPREGVFDCLAIFFLSFGGVG